ncbi:MAG: hypothetical protein RL180_683 [Pseudomonadota bacterium]|jgi:hypothetical protein
MMNIRTLGVMVVAALGTVMASAEQQCNTNIPQSAPDQRFRVVAGSNGSELQDLFTDLVWQRCSIGQQWNNTSKTCTGVATLHTWPEALAQAKAVGGDYRLPNIKELHTLREPRCAAPSLNIAIFPNLPTTETGFRVWSSSPYAGDTLSAWMVDFEQGTTIFANKSSAIASVRAVRAGAAVATP